MPTLLHHAVFTDLRFCVTAILLAWACETMVSCNSRLAWLPLGVASGLCPGTRPREPHHTRPAVSARRGHPIYRPAPPYLSAWGNRSSSVFGCPSVSRFGRGDTASANSCRAAGPECRRKLLMGRNRAWCSWDGRIVCLAVVSRNLGYQFSLLWR